jgi:hypothetical protein
MIRIVWFTFAVVVTATTLGAFPDRTVNAVTLNGWFSDKQCAPSKLKSESVTPNGTMCVKKCLDEGATPVFVNPRTRAMYDVKDHPSVNDDVGYYLEVTGVVDEEAKTIAVRSVKRLGEVIQTCARPAKKKE